MENHHCSWENSLFLWLFSIAMLNYQRVYVYIYIYIHICSDHTALGNILDPSREKIGVDRCVKREGSTQNKQVYQATNAWDVDQQNVQNKKWQQLYTHPKMSNIFPKITIRGRKNRMFFKFVHFVSDLFSYGCSQFYHRLFLWLFPVFSSLFLCLPVFFHGFPIISYIYFWANYNNSLTWIKAIWGWFPFLTMISRVRS